MRPRAVTDEAILAAARACLFARGPSATVTEIAGRVGVSGPAVLKRFGSKERLVMRALVSEGPPDLSQGPESGDLQPQIIKVLLHLERMLREAAPALATMRAGGIDVSRRIGNAPPRVARQHLEAWLERARRSHATAHPDPAAAADLLVSLVEARAFLNWIEPSWVPGGQEWARRAVAAVFGDARVAPARRTGRRAATPGGTGARRGARRAPAPRRRAEK